MAASSAFHRALESISKIKGENYREWRDKLREAIALYSHDMVDLLDGTPCPPATGANVIKGENYREWRDKLREAIALYSHDMVDLLDGTPCPPATGANVNAAGATAWTMLNSKLYSILFSPLKDRRTQLSNSSKLVPKPARKRMALGRGKHIRYASTATQKKPVAHAVRS